ncbi:hypothetical protein RHSIM_Rhsim04G0146700 [Rhododendron simsii]|uniref:Uncharacterized protein n=1 Tax=Rhododendron simsii TaxID=118357 RepID=A0A834H0A2_RHOSS|nr:hypothetical protein RHSIM_Rhsim04G0146700 [Rhododendron simsii]
MPASSIPNVANHPVFGHDDWVRPDYSTTFIFGESLALPVKGAQMSTGTVAVKVLATNSRHGEKEFQSEIAQQSMVIIW